MLISSLIQFKLYEENHLPYYLCVILVLISTNAHSVQKLSPLAAACKNNDTQMITILLVNGANPDELSVSQLLPCSRTKEQKILISLRNKLNVQNKLKQEGTLWNMYLNCDGKKRPNNQNIDEYLKAMHDEAMNLFDLGIHVDSTDERGRSALIAASGSCPKTFISEIVSSGASINHADNNGNTALINASGWNDVEVVKLLLSKKANVNHLDEEGNSALHKASELNINEVVQLLLAAKANVNTANNQGLTPLMMASITGATDIVNTLIEATANIDLVNANGETALIIAAKKNHTDIIIALIDAGANINISSQAGESALHFATLHKNTKVTQSMMAAGGTVKPDEIEITWEEALATGNVPAVKLWLPHSPDMKIEDKEGESILHWKNVINNGELIRLLVNAGATASDLNKNNETVLQQYLKIERKSLTNRYGKKKSSRFIPDISIIDLLAKKGASNINHFDSSGHTAIFSVFQNNNIIRNKKENVEAILTTLIRSGADINKTNRDGRTLLQTVPLNYMNMLLRLGVNANTTDDDGVSELMKLTQKIPKHSSPVFNAIYDLISADVDLNHQANDGTTALMIAVEKGNISVIEALLAAGADINIRDNKNRTAWHRAVGLKEYRLFLILLAENPQLAQDERCEVEQFLLMKRYQVTTRKSLNAGKPKERVTIHVDTLDRVLHSDYPEDLDSVLSFAPKIYSKDRLNKSYYQHLTYSSLNLEMLLTLNKHGGDINAIHEAVYTPLSLMIKNKWTNNLDKLLQAGADPHVKDKDGKPLIQKRDIEYYISNRLKKINEESELISKKCKAGENAQRYLAFDDFILDNKNNIIWKRCPQGMQGQFCTGVAKLHVHSDALKIAENEVYTDKKDWRLPNERELKSLYDLDCATNRKGIDKNYFPDVQEKGYWTSSHVQNKRDARVWIDLGNGRVSNYTYKYTYSSNWALQRVWLVHDWVDSELDK